MNTYTVFYAIVLHKFALLCIFCRFPETGGEFHDDPHDGLISVCRKLILRVFPRFVVNGYEELHSAAPVLYVGESARDIGLSICSQVMHGEHICSFICAPKSRIVKFNIAFDVTSSLIG